MGGRGWLVLRRGPAGTAGSFLGAGGAENDNIASYPAGTRLETNSAFG